MGGGGGRLFGRSHDQRSQFKAHSAFPLLQLCAIDFIVDNNKQLLNIGRRILGRTLFNKLMKATIYGQFVGGEDKIDIQGTISKNMAFGVKSILDYSAEEDMSSAKVSCLCARVRKILHRP